MMRRVSHPLTVSIVLGKMRYRLRTLLLLMAVGPPVIGFWGDIRRHVITRAAHITASDVAVVAAATTLVAMRMRVYVSATDESERVRNDARVG
jgi:hypothetical protein